MKVTLYFIISFPVDDPEDAIFTNPIDFREHFRSVHGGGANAQEIKDPTKIIKNEPDPLTVGPR